MGLRYEILIVRGCKSDGNMRMMLFDDFKNMNSRQLAISRELGDSFEYHMHDGPIKAIPEKYDMKPGDWAFENDSQTGMGYCKGLISII